MIHFVRLGTDFPKQQTPAGPRCARNRAEHLVPSHYPWEPLLLCYFVKSPGQALFHRHDTDSQSDLIPSYGFTPFHGYLWPRSPKSSPPVYPTAICTFTLSLYETQCLVASNRKHLWHMYAEKNLHLKRYQRKTSLVQWLRLRTSNAGGVGSIPGWGTKIPHAAWQKKKEKKDIK